MKNLKYYIFILLPWIIFLAFKLSNIIERDAVVHFKVVDNLNELPIENTRVTILVVNKPLIGMRGQTLKHVGYTNKIGLVSFILKSNKDYVVWFNTIENDNFDYLDIENPENHSSYLKKMPK